VLRAKVASRSFEAGELSAQSGGREDEALSNLWRVAANTPYWVWALLGLLLVTGFQGLRPRVVAVARVLLLPSAFLAWGVYSLLSRGNGIGVAGSWLTAAVAGGILAAVTAPTTAPRFSGGTVHLPGSPVPLLRNQAIFVLKYALAVALMLAPAERSMIILSDACISGVVAGYFLAWSARFLLAYRQVRLLGPERPVAG
jgi:hypothetical protein